jgi:hypothetical protein
LSGATLEAWTEGDGSYPLPSIAEMSAEIGMSERMLRRYLKQAEADGWIMVRGDRFRPSVPDHLAHLLPAVRRG